MVPLRDESPDHRFPVAVIFLILLNLGGYVGELNLGERPSQLFYVYGLVPISFTYHGAIDFPSSPFFSLVTFQFLHGSLPHLVGNIWFLWIFGGKLEDYLGHFGFFVLYLLGGVATGMIHILFNLGSSDYVIGASGAISGVMGAYFILFPKIRVRTLVFLGFYLEVVRIPAYFFLGIWGLLIALGGLGQDSGVALISHLGGFLTGVVFTLLISRRRDKDEAPWAPFQPVRENRF